VLLGGQSADGDFDVKIDCTGFKREPASFLTTGCLSSSLKDAQLRVNKHLQVTDQSGGTLSHIFSIGDVALTPADEEKSIVPIYQMTGVLAHNLAVLAGNDPNKALKEIPEVFHRVYLINFGQNGAGLMIWNDLVVEFTGRVPVVRSVMNVASFKKRIETMNMGALRGKRLAKWGLSIQQKGMNALFWFGNRDIFRNRSFHISRAKQAVERRKEKH